MEEQAKKVARLLKMLANEHRLLILCALMKGPCTVSQLHCYVPTVTASALSQHLGQMRMAGLLESQRQGMNIVYRIQDQRVVSLMGAIQKYYCEPPEDGGAEG